MNKQKLAQEKQYREQAKYKTLFSQEPPNPFGEQDVEKMKHQYAQILKEQILDSQRHKEQQKTRDRQETQKQIQYESPFGKDRLIHLQKLNKELLKPIQDIDEFVRKKNQTDISRPKTILKNQSTERSNQQHSNDNSLEQAPQYNFDSPNQQEYIQNRNQTQILPTQQTQRNRDYQSSQSLGLPEPILSNNSNLLKNNNKNIHFPIQLPPKTPGIVYDKQNNPILSDYLSIYDQQFSRLHKSEKSDFIKELNQLRSQFFVQQKPQVQPFKQIVNLQQQSPPKITSDIGIQDDQYRLEQLERERQEEQFRYQEYLRQLEEEKRRQQEEFEKQLREKIERELEEQKRLKQQEIEIQTEKLVTDTGIQHVDQNAVTAAEYMKTLKSLSGSVIDMKNQFIQGQQKLNYELIQLRDKAQRDIEEKLRIQKELKELEQRNQAIKVWEGEKQRQLMQALEKNAPITQYKSVFMDPKQINPTLKKVIRFKDQTQGYEYEEPNVIFSKSNLMPLNGGYDQKHLHNLKANEPVLPEELEIFKQEVAPQLKYSNQITKKIRMDDLYDQFYDYKYPKQLEHPGQERLERSKHETQIKNDPNQILLENDRRLHELGIIDPKGDNQQIQELYDYL
ncbi:unnamed protein product (macronuclear) [Paramecium tetraurelia]|uniref:Uncharacterized protein n=1 Tax=Paramecium tetraurelia TaxID=5888 RepID=A0EE49_PARTE|nr:uncharacterized protein GSPATT00025910001 [Paramecium tetraurelia]CAK93566.1 unnamed protein product [Paramecium tetraurelia]|eukprot:XP_001460963.1 hypothetical protein (macronuclear) [Paramecium tetraurelia strain d4-2]